MDIQNILNHKYSIQFLSIYEKDKALSVIITSREHYVLTKYKTKSFISIEDFIYQEVISINNYTKVPINSINLILEKLTNKYLK